MIQSIWAKQRAFEKSAKLDIVDVSNISHFVVVLP